MSKIKITVEEDGQEIDRLYEFQEIPDNEKLGEIVADMLNTLEKANDPKF